MVKRGEYPGSTYFSSGYYSQDFAGISSRSKRRRDIRKKSKGNYKPLEQIPPAKWLTFQPHRHSTHSRHRLIICRLGNGWDRLQSKLPPSRPTTCEDKPRMDTRLRICGARGR